MYQTMTDLTSALHAHKSKQIVGCVGTRVYASNMVNDDRSKSWLGLITFEFERCAAGGCKCGIRQEWLVDARTGKGNGEGVEDGEGCGKDRRVLWSRREGTLVEWLENSAGFGIGRKCLYE